MISSGASAGAAFVVGTGRCGSTLLSRLLARHPRILSLSEVFAALGPEAALRDELIDGPGLWKLLSEPRSEVSRLLASAEVPEVVLRWDGAREGRVAPLMLATLPLLSSDPEALLRELGEFTRSLSEQPAGLAFSASFAWLAARLDKSMWVERSGGSLAYVQDILRLWPEARVVHLWRAGVDCALSMSRHPYFRVAVARAAARDPGLDVVRALEARTPLDRFGAYWCATILRGLAALAAHGRERVLTIRYESLLERPAHHLSRLAGFFEVEAPAAWISACIPELRRPEARADLAAESSRSSLQRICLPGERALLKWDSGE